MAEKTFFERYGSEILTDNKILNHFAQCKTCVFRDRTTVRGDECGWEKGYCQIYEKGHYRKPNPVFDNKSKCAYYREEKRASREGGALAKQESDYPIGVKYAGFKRGQEKQQIDALTSIINKSSYNFDIWVQRGCRRYGMDNFLGIDMSDFDLPEAELAQKLVGKHVIEYAFMSTSVVKINISGDVVVFNIYAPRGTKMMYIEPISHYGKGAGRKWDGILPQNDFSDEPEMLLQRGTKFEITKVEKRGKTIYIDMDVIKQEVD